MNQDAITAADTLARKRIIEETNRNFFVEAGAGSGKTTSLVARMTAMVAAGIDIRRVAAITYTKAAAREFYVRFQKSLDEQRRNTACETLRQRYTQALLDIDLCFMGTIDAFCNLVLGEHPIEAGLPLNTAVLGDKQLMEAYRREWLSLKRGGYGDELTALYNSFAQFHQNPDAVFECAIRGFMSTRENAHDYAPFLETDVDERFKDERRAFISIAEHTLAHPEAQKAKQNGEPSAEVAALKRGAHVFETKWSQNIPRVIKLLGDIDSLRLTRSPESIGIMDSGYFEYPEGRKRDYVLRTKESSLYHTFKELQFSVTVELLDRFSKGAAERLKSNGELDFFDYILYLRNLLRDDAMNGAALTRHIASRHSFFLIDEFQDTNPLQAEIFFHLAAKEPNPCWTKCVPRQGSLFIVGDPKQSIYRFQGADVSSFLRVKQLFTGEVGDVLELSRNYRSGNDLREWFNEVFRAMMPTSTDIQSAFTPIPDNGRKEVRGSVYGVYKYTTAQNDDPARAADIIQSLVADETKTIGVFEGGQARVRCIKYDDFMLITRNKTHIYKYINEFTARGIPFRVEGKTAFSECGALRALAAVMAAIAAPTDSLSVYTALKCALFHINDSDILAWREAGRKLSLFDHDGEGSVPRALGTLLRARLSVNELTPHAAAQKISEMLDILPNSGKERLEYYYFALELLRQAETTGDVFSLEGAAAFLSGLLNNEHERELSLVRKASGVHIANLHKVKGLEAPIVILGWPQNRNSVSPALSTSHSDTGATTVFLKVAERGASTHAETFRQTAVKELETAQLAAEELRLKYVAATRAGSALIISSLENEDGASNTWREFALASNRALAFSDNLLSAQTDDKPNIDMNQIQQEAEQAGALMRKAGELSYKISRPSMFKVKSKTSAEDEYDDMIASDIEAAARHRHASLIGTMTHRMMELLVLSGGGIDAEALTRAVMAEFDVFGETGEQIAAAIKYAAERMKSGGFPQSNGITPDLLSELRGASSVMCEIPLCVLADDPEYMLDGLPTLLHGIIDLVYEKDGRWHIVDYKTTIDPSDLDEHYMRQLASYAYGFERVTGHKAEARTYHIQV